MKHIKITSVLLSALMCASMVMTPVPVMADETEVPAETQTTEETEIEEPEVKEEKTPSESDKKPALEANPTGKVENIKWTYNVKTKTITITGSGKMPDFAYNDDSHWHRYRNKIEKVVIGKGITFIGKSSFRKFTKIKSISIPSSVTEIGEYAFEGCTSLKSVTIPGSVKRIWIDAFEGCTSLKNVKLNKGLDWIDYGVFANTAITEIKIPETVTKITNFAFAETKLKTVKLPNGIVGIGGGTFMDCKYLTSVTLPSGLKSISYNLFNGCTNLKSVKIPDGVTKIEEGAFMNCSSLASINIPAGVKSIKYDAFTNCPLLNDVYYGGKKSAWNKISIHEDNKGIQVAAIHLSDGTVIPSKKAENTLTVTGNASTVKYKKLKKKSRTVPRAKVMTVADAKGKVTYKLVSVSKTKFKKYFKINPSNGVVTVKKKIKKGTYVIKCTVTAAGNEDVKPLSQTVTFTIKVK